MVHKLYIVILCLCMSISYTHAQCSFSGQLPIKDNDTTRLNIALTGANINDLSDPGQGLCQVNLLFKHDFVTDLNAYLISPAGQRVRLLGKGEQNGPGTNLVTWNIKFISCDFTAEPDPGFSESWNNNQTWSSLQTYNGTYYPYEGCLSDFNTGPVNGLWTLEFVDVSMFAEGVIQGFELVFCGGDVACDQCSPGEHRLTSENISICQSDLPVNTEVRSTYIDPPGRAADYGYGYFIFKDTSLVQFNNNIDYEALGAGSFSVCGVSYRKGDVERLQDMIGLNRDEVVSISEEKSVCFSLSNNCIDLDIIVGPEEVTDSVTLCQGEFVTIQGVRYDTTGVYRIRTSRAGCDSISYLDLTIDNNPYTIQQSVAQLDCDNIFIDLSIDQLDQGDALSWTAFDSDFDFITDGIRIYQPGTVELEINTSSCTYTELIEVSASDDFVNYSVQVEDISCQQDTATLSVQGSKIDSSHWDSLNPFDMEANSIKVTQGGTYTVNVIGESGCRSVRTVEVEVDTTISGLSTYADTLNCLDPQGVIGVTSESGSYTYKWSKDGQEISTEAEVTVNDGGRYIVAVSDSKGCTEELTVNVVDRNVSLNANVFADTITCASPTARVFFVSNQSKAGLNILWTDPEGNQYDTEDLDASLAGEYRLNISTDGGCGIQRTFDVVADTTVTPYRVSNASFGCGEDSIRVNVSNLRPGDQVTWYGEDFESNETRPWIFNQGDYVLSINSANGCNVLDSIDITANGDVPKTSFTRDTLDCNTATVDIVAGNTEYDYEWTLPSGGVETGPSLTVDVAGSYRVKVIDNNEGCSGFYTVNIVEDYSDTLTLITATDIDCQNKTSTLSAESSRGVESILWLDSTRVALPDSTTKTPGLYFAEYTLNNGCTGSDSIAVMQVEVSANISLASQPDTITCSTPSVALSAATETLGQFSVFWYHESGESLTGLRTNTSLPGKYDLVIMANGNCSDTVEVNIPADTLSPIIDLSLDAPLRCTDSISTIFNTGDSLRIESWQWGGNFISDDKLESIDVNEAGIYSLIVTGENGCTSTASLRVNSEIEYPDYQITNNTITCTAPAVMGIVDTDEDNSVIWENASLRGTSFNALNPRIERFNITNPQGCTTLDSVVISIDTLSPVLEIAKSNDINCLFDTTELTVVETEQDVTYTWSGPDNFIKDATTLTTSISGDYIMEATGPNGCASASRISVDMDNQPPNIEIQGDAITCNAGKTVLMVDTDKPIATYTWSSDEGFESTSASPLILNQGIYKVEVVGENGCEAEDTILITDVREFPTLVMEDAYLPCDGSQTTISPKEVDEGVIQRWYGPRGLFVEGPTLSTSFAGEYVGLIIDEKMCITTDTFQVIDEAVPPVFSLESDTLYCTTGAVLTSIDTEDDREVEWVSPEGELLVGQQVTAMTPGIYQVIVTGSNACTATADIEVPDGRVFPEPSISQLDPFQCKVELVRLSASADNRSYNYQWTALSPDGSFNSLANAPVATVKGEGQYSVMLTDLKTGCTGIDTFDLRKDVQSFQDVNLVYDLPTCVDFKNAAIYISEYVGGYAPYTLSLNGESYGTSWFAKYLSPGDYAITVTDSLGCEVMKDLTITEGYYPNIELPQDTLIQLGDELTLTPAIYPDTMERTIIWEPTLCNGCTSLDLKPTEDILVKVTLVDKYGCEKSDEMFIKVSTSQAKIFPNIFSPNGDNNNDVFYVPYKKGVSRIIDLQIVDWNGVVVHEQNDFPPGEKIYGWDGNFNNAPALSGTYIYSAIVLLENGESIKKVGSVTLVR